MSSVDESITSLMVLRRHTKHLKQSLDSSNVLLFSQATHFSRVLVVWEWLQALPHDQLRHHPTHYQDKHLL